MIGDATLLAAGLGLFVIALLVLNVIATIVVGFLSPRRCMACFQRINHHGLCSQCRISPPQNWINHHE